MVWHVPKCVAHNMLVADMAAHMHSGWRLLHQLLTGAALAAAAVVGTVQRSLAVSKAAKWRPHDGYMTVTQHSHLALPS
jgi:hypothetical protein